MPKQVILLTTKQPDLIKILWPKTCMLSPSMKELW